MADGTGYTLALWRVKAGKEDEFVRRWKGELADYFLNLPKPPGPGTLIRSVEDLRVFYSFGPWRSIEDIREMRADPRTADVLGNVIELCDEATPGVFEFVARVPEDGS
jgi:hypothetical protein